VPLAQIENEVLVSLKATQVMSNPGQGT